MTISLVFSISMFIFIFAFASFAIAITLLFISLQIYQLNNIILKRGDKKISTKINKFATITWAFSWVKSPLFALFLFLRIWTVCILLSDEY